jgi:TrpR-related protein YerC/YecD
MINESYPDDFDQQLIKAFASLKSETEIEAFLRDIFTIAEIKEASRRFQIAKRLWLGNTNYLQIASDLKTSTTTVTRVADWLFNKGLHGYLTVLQRLHPKQTISEKK